MQLFVPIYEFRANLLSVCYAYTYCKPITYSLYTLGAQTSLSVCSIWQKRIHHFSYIVSIGYTSCQPLSYHYAFQSHSATTNSYAIISHTHTPAKLPYFDCFFLKLSNATLALSLSRARMPISCRSAGWCNNRAPR